MNEPRSPFAHFSWVGGHPILNFVNTVHHRYRDDPHDYLPNYDALVHFCLEANVIDAERARVLRLAGERETTESKVVLGRALRLREALYNLLATVIEDRPPEAETLETMNQDIAKMMAQRRINWHKGGYSWGWRNTLDDTPEQILWPLLWEASRFLAEGDMSRLKRCPRPHGCGWVFLDRSKNRSRRWCSMKDCGNLAKVKRHYQRHKQSG